MDCHEKEFGCLCRNVGGHFPCLFHGLNVKQTLQKRNKKSLVWLKYIFDYFFGGNYNSTQKTDNIGTKIKLRSHTKNLYSQCLDLRKVANFHALTIVLDLHSC